MNRSKSPSETLHRVRCLSEHRGFKIIKIPVVFAPEQPAEVITILQSEWRKLTPAERVKRWRDSQ